MALIFIVLIVLVSIILAFLVLVQNPKGGGLATGVGGLSNQLLGVKQTTDVLEKGTWITASVIGLLCLFSSIFVGKNETVGKQQQAPQQNSQPAPAPAAPAGGG